MKTYIPPPEHSPLLFNRPAWAGGLTVLFLLAVAAAAIPTIYGLVLLAWELDGAIRP